LVELNWTKGLSKGVSYYITSINKGKFNIFINNFIAYKVVLNINIFSILVKLKVLTKGY
jgi:hypothetical protein